MIVREIQDADRAWLGALIEREWGLPVVSVSGVCDPTELPALVAYEGPEPLGALTYRLQPDGCEVVTLNALVEGRGVGSALLAAARDVADERGQRLWLVTTNANIRAIGFYQRRGMDLVALHRDFVDVVRRHKPTVADGSGSGIPMRHALEFAFPPRPRG